MALPKLFQVNPYTKTADVALLAIRLLAGLIVFNFSGAPKLTQLASLLSSGADPLQLGSPLAAPAMLFAAFALGICTLLVVVGLVTRYAALFVSISLAGTLFLIDHALSVKLSEPSHNGHGEAIWLFLAQFIALTITGPGRYSLDALLSKCCSKK